MESHMSSTLHEANEENDSLHIAARAGQKEIMLQILGRHPSLIYHQNIEGDNPLHVAAGAGQLGVVELLTSFVLRAAQSTAIDIRIDPPENGAARSSVPIWRTENRVRSTALHEALRNKHEDVALHLLDLDSGLAVLANARNESPLYLAAKAGFVCVLNKILEAGGQPNTVGPNGQTPYHAAVSAKSQESIRILYGSIPALINKKDLDGKTALYYATEVDSLEIIRLLLELDPSSASTCDNKGFSPLLVAVKNGRVASLQAILDACPASKKGELINKSDQEGNTPLHLATMTQKYQHVQLLLSSKLVHLEAKNTVGLTALDICNSDGELSDRQKKIRKALQYKPASNIVMRFIRALDPASSRKVVEGIPEEDRSVEMSMIGVVAALLATITFTAVFQLPGGYNSDNGSPVLTGQAHFENFIRYNSLAFCFSIVGLYYLLLAALAGPDKISPSKAINYAAYAVAAALLLATFSFRAGMNAVMSIEVEDEGLATFVNDAYWVVLGLFIAVGFSTICRGCFNC